MNKKNLVLISKCCLLLAFLGFCLPVFNVRGSAVTGFLPIVELLKAGPSDLKKASANLNDYEEKNASFVAHLDEFKAANKVEIKEAKAKHKFLLKDAKAESKKALAAAKVEYKNNKVKTASDIESIKESYSKNKESLDSKLKEAKKNSLPNEEIKAIEAEIATLTASMKEDIRSAENKLKSSKRSADIAARKIYSRVELAANKEIKAIENKYWEEYDKYNNNTRQKLVAAKSNAVKEIWVPIALIIFVVSIIASILFSTVHYITLKKDDYSKVHYFVDMLLLVIIVITNLYAFNAIKDIDGDVISGVESGFGNIFVVIGVVASVITYLLSTTIDENISSESEERRAYWMLSSPAIIFYFAVMTFPAIFSVVLSFSNYGGGPLTLTGRGHFDFIGFDNYAKVFQDPYFYVSLKNNFYVVLISVFGQLPLGFLLAYVLNRGLVKGRDFFQTMIYLPCVISTVIIGILFQTFFAANGVWTELMRKFNENYQWSMNNHPMIPVLFVILWMYTGTYLIIFLANLQKLDPGIIEAATIDGATEGQVLWHIIFPELSGTFVISAILAISGSLKSFDLIYVMTAGGPAKQTYVLALYMFDKAFKGAADYPMANTISTIMVVISLALIAVVKTLEKKFGTSDDD